MSLYHTTSGVASVSATSTLRGIHRLANTEHTQTRIIMSLVESRLDTSGVVQSRDSSLKRGAIVLRYWYLKPLLMRLIYCSLDWCVVGRGWYNSLRRW